MLDFSFLKTNLGLEYKKVFTTFGNAFAHEFKPYVSTVPSGQCLYVPPYPRCIIASYKCGSKYETTIRRGNGSDDYRYRNSSFIWDRNELLQGVGWTQCLARLWCANIPNVDAKLTLLSLLSRPAAHCTVQPR